ncbi:MAG: periplasmic heavy metal sensor [Candidatus Zeuxoniibacter abyssi]|nr:MAG: periplasmic heavy metal sensor [Candidatus Persebacteraceae bacterium AB1(2)]
MKRKTLIVAVIAIAFMFGGAALASYRGEHRMEHMQEHISEELGLDAAQEEKLNDVFENIAVFVEGEKQRAEKKVKNIISQDTLSTDDAKQLLGMRRHHAEKKRDFMAEQLAAFHAVLSPKQRLAAADMMLEHMKHRGRHKRRGHSEHGKYGDNH